MDIRRDKFLAFARRLALLTPALAACGGSNATTATTTTAPTARPSSSVSEMPPGDATAGGGPCRCSWDTNGAAAPRVCKKGEANYEGMACVPGQGTSYGEGYNGPMVVPGPLPPPDLAAV